MTYSIEVKRSKRKTLSVEVRPDGKLVIRAPYRMPDQEIRRFLKEKEKWIEKHVLEAKEKSRQVDYFSEQEIRDLVDEACAYFPSVVHKYAEMIGVSYGRITIRNQRTRWGSCSSQGNLNFNCLLMLLSEEIREYVIVHELCHRIEMNHSPAFWKEVETYCPEYKRLRRELKEKGSCLLTRIR